MTPEDLAQIAAIVAAAEQRTNAATAAAIAAAEQRINATTASAIAAAEERIVARQERAVESIATEFSTARGEMKERFQSVEVRLERIENLGYSMNMQTAGMSRAIGDGERLMSEILARQSAQQQAFFELQTRVAKIERELHPTPGSTDISALPGRPMSVPRRARHPRRALQERPHRNVRRCKGPSDPRARQPRRTAGNHCRHR